MINVSKLSEIYKFPAVNNMQNRQILSAQYHTMFLAIEVFYSRLNTSNIENVK